MGFKTYLVKVRNIDFGLKLLVYFHSDSFPTDLKERISARSEA